MSRRASLAALALSVALVAGSIVALVAGVALGAWQPAGPPPPTVGPTIFPGTDELRGFLDEVRAGRVREVTQDGAQLTVNTGDSTYTILLPSPDYDIFSAMDNAARDGGVPTPEFTIVEPGVRLAYRDLLDEVRAGRVYEVLHEGDRLTAYGDNTTYEVDVPAGVDSVLADLEAAAEDGGVQAPYYTKVPATGRG